MIEDQVASFDAYPFEIPAIRALGTLDLHSKVTFLVGEDGSGKSTRVEAIAVAAGFNAEGGTKNFNFAPRRSESPRHATLRLARGMRRGPLKSAHIGTMSADILVPLAAMALPVAIVWIRTHYKALEKGHVQSALGDGKQRILQLEEQNRDLLERVQNLESIVVSLDEAPKRKVLPSPALAPAKMSSDE